MNDRPWWATALQWSIWWILMFAVMGWFGRSRLRPRRDLQPGELRMPHSVLVIGLLCFGFFATILVLSNVYSNHTTTWWTSAVFAGFALMALPMIADYFLARHRADARGLSYWSYFGGQKRMVWSDVREVRFAAAMKWFRLRDASGGTARISIMLVGLPEFARLLLAHAPPQAIDSQTRDLLEATAADHPPPVW